MTEQLKEPEAGRRTALSAEAQLPIYIICGIVLIAAAKAAAPILGPLLLAAVIVVAVQPVMRRLIERNVPPWLAFVLTCLAVVVFTGGLLVVLWFSLAGFIGSLSNYSSELQRELDAIKAVLAQLGMASADLESIKALSSGAIIEMVSSIGGWIAGALTAGGIALFYAAFMLLESIDFQNKLRVSLGEPRVTDRVLDFAEDMRKFVSITAVSNFVVAVGDVVFFVIMGIDFPLLWGVLSFLFGFIPNIGFWLAAIGPVALALLESGPGAAAIVLVGIIVINGGVQNILQPRWMGRGLDLSPFVVIFSVFFWTWIIGPLGAVLAVVLTMIVRLVLSLSPTTERFAYLLGTGKTPPTFQAAD